MSKLKKDSDKSADLRKKAEKKLNTQLDRLKELSSKGAHALAQELGTHQIELEMQIEELQRAQVELEASRSKYSDLYDFAPVGYLTFDAAGVVREANLAAAKMLGIERRYLLNKPFSGFLSKDDNDAFRLHCAAILENRTKQSIEVRLKRRDKTEFFARLESVVVEGAEGNAAAIRTAASDITERRRAEETLQKSELRYRSLFENMLDGYAFCRMLHDDRGRPTDFVYLSVNSSFERLTGLKNVVGMKVTDVIPGIRESHPELLETYGRVAATGKTEKFEIEFKPLGMWLSVSVYSTEREHFTAVFDNISVRKDAVFALGRSEEKYRLLFKNMAEGFALYELLYDDRGTPADWRVLEVNDAYVQHTGISRELIVGRRISELFPESIPEYLPRFREVVATQKPVEFETYSKPADRYLHIVCFPAGPNRFANTVTDITERKRAEDDLKKSRDRVELLARITGGLLQTDAPQKMIDTFCRQVMTHLNCSVFFNYLADAQTGGLRLNSYAGIPEDEALRIERLEYGAAVCGCVARDSTRIIAERIQTTPDERTDLVRSYGIRAYACHPILGSDGKAMGTLSFGTKSRDVFTSEELDLMKAVTDQVSIAMIRMKDEQALKERERKYRTLIDRMIDGFALHEIVLDASGLPRDYRFLEVNKAFERLTGLRNADIVGKCVTEVLPGIRESNFDWIAAYGKVALTGEELRTEQYAEELGKWYSITAYRPQERLFATIFEDITARKQAEDAAMLHAKQLAERNEELARFNRVAVDRELRMIELKKEINAALAEAGKPRRYPLAFENGPET